MRNTARFLLSNIHDFDPAAHQVKPDEMLALDRWVVMQAQTLQQRLIEAYDKFEFHQIYQKVLNFCVVELGGFYLDVIKDRQYTCQKGSLARRSAQTAIYHIVEAMARWLAPIVSFTAEEIWRHIPGSRGESVFLATWYQFPVVTRDTRIGVESWDQVMAVRDEVSKVLEGMRNADQIGAGLEAEVDLYLDDELLAALSVFADELRFIFITSEARVHPAAQRPAETQASALPGVWIAARPSAHAKCPRCWHRREDVGVNSDHPSLCGRCAENVAGAGEVRQFA